MISGFDSILKQADRKPGEEIASLIAAGRLF
jgi:hypothetical protein